MDACTVLGALDSDFALSDRLVFQTSTPAREARTAELRDPLHPELAERLAARKIRSFFTHQAEAIDRLRVGEHVVVTTGTASGKSLCYQVPILESVIGGTRDTALLIFPTKALAHDQLRSIRSWLVSGLRAVTYDGDTPPDDRQWARKHGNLVLTNPEMLHMGMLPMHQRWSDFFLRLRYVVIDELHTLRGIFGSHVAHLLRRLRRVCAHYGSSPTFFFASATIGNPAELASGLCGLDVHPIDDDGAPQGERCFGVWQRPLLDVHTGARASANAETATILSRFVRAEQQTLAFTRSRKSAELVASLAKQVLADDAPALASRVSAYRAGYLGEERRALEAALAKGELLGVAATNALELGIDVGTLDAVIVNGFPGTLASLRQQIGRAGRSGRRSAGVLIAGDDQLDQWYVRHPTALFDRAAEPAVINPSNPYVMRPQISCAAHELPLTPADVDYFGEAIDDVVRELVLDDLLVARRGRMVWAGATAPAPGVGLRTGTSEEFQLLDQADERLIGTVDGARVGHVAHPGAIYLHQGRQFRVDRLDVVQRIAFLNETDDDEYTQPREETALSIVNAETRVAMGRGYVDLGTVEVTSRLVAYQRKRASTNEVIESCDLDIPPRSLPTRACWYTIPAETLAFHGVAGAQVLGAVHAAEHGLIGLLPLFTICDRWDVGGVSMAAHPQTGEPTIFVYDGYPGGAGIAELAFAALEPHIAATLDLLRSCPCSSGCPSCVQSPKCGNWNEYLDKHAAIVLLGLLAD